MIDHPQLGTVPAVVVSQTTEEGSKSWEFVGRWHPTHSGRSHDGSEPVATPRTNAKLIISLRTRVSEEEYAALLRLADQDCSNVSLIVRRFIRRQLAAAKTVERGNVAV